jgi:hypothetical protein
MNNLIQKISKSWWWKAYRKLPLWGQFAAPAVAFLLLVAAFKMFGWVIQIAIVAVVAYFAFSFYLKVKEGSGKNRRI